MTTQLEQEFYKAFEIPPATVEEYGSNYFWDTIEIDGKRYTPIDDRKLLEMICILNKHYAENFQCATMLVGGTTEKIKECILKDCIEQSQHIKSEIQQLFKEEE